MPLTGSDFILIIWREEIERNTTFIVTNRPPDTALFKRGAIPVSPKVPSVRVSERGPSERRQTWGPHPQGPQGLLCWPRHGRKHNNIFIFVNVLSALWPYSLQVHPETPSAGEADVATVLLIDVFFNESEFKFSMLGRVNPLIVAIEARQAKPSSLSSPPTSKGQ